MGELLKADFKTKLSSKLSKYDPQNTQPRYQADVFSELFDFPQFKAHVAAYVERNYCVVVNDEDHPDPQSLMEILSPKEIRMLNKWIVNRHNKPSVVKNK
ncbi:MAG: hypothetical protein ACE5E9_01725 [Nitrospinaceae bacterium]